MPGNKGFWQIPCTRGSRISVKRRGDRGHPCLVPLCKSNWADIMPFVNTTAHGFECSILTQEMNPSPKPKAFRVLIEKDHSTQSNVFSASNEMAPVGEFTFWVVHMTLMKRLILSKKLCQQMNPTWFGCTRQVIILSNLPKFLPKSFVPAQSMILAYCFCSL